MGSSALDTADEAARTDAKGTNDESRRGVAAPVGVATF